MIEAFTTKKVVSLPTGKIECIIAYGDKLLLGLTTGTLIVYTLTDPFSKDLEASWTSAYEAFTKRAVEKLGVVKDAGGLIVLSEGTISMFDLESYNLIEHLQHSKGATDFEVIDGIMELEPGYQAMVSRLAVACKKRLVVYEWRDSEFATHHEITLPDRIRSLTFLSHNLVVCALGTEYSIVDISKEQVVNVVNMVATTDQPQSSYSSYLGLGARVPDPKTIRLGDKSGKVLAVREDAGQFININGDQFGEAIKFDHSPEVLGYSYPYLTMISDGKIEVRNAETSTLLQILEFPNVKCVNNGKHFFAASGSEVMRLIPTDYASQIQALASDNGNLREAISLLEQIESVLIKDKENTLRDLLMLKAVAMFKEGQFEDSLQLFSDISAPPHTVIALFPEELSGSDLRGNEDVTEIPEDMFKPVVRKLQEYLSDTRRRIAKLSDSTEKIKFQGFELSEKIYGDLGQAAALVDTTLFRCYIRTSLALVGPLVRVSNHCDPQVVKQNLEKLHKWKELVDFYYGKGLHREALDLLKKLADDESSLLDGPEPTVSYLKRLKDENIDLIFEFGKWTIEQNREYGYQLFIDDTAESLTRQKVQKFLACLSDPSCYLVIEYLEHVTGELDDPTPSINTGLGLAYIKSIQNGDKDLRRDSFLEFIKSNNRYRPDRLLLEIPPDQSQFLEPRALLHGRRGEHSKALELYAIELNDAAQAREYCSDVYNNDTAQGKECLHLLLGLYLSRNSISSQSDNILQLLSSQGSRMSVIDVISKLPADIRINDITAFLQSQLRSLHSTTLAGQLDASLRRVNLVRTQEQLLELGQKHALITNLRTCTVCHKRLGHSVISMFPDGAVVHYGCRNQYHQTMENGKNRLKTVKVGSR